MIDVLPIIGAGFIGIATIGFLLIQHFLENKITQHKADVSELIAKQEQVLHWIDKSQADRRQAGLTQQNLVVMKALGVSKVEYDKTQESYMAKLRSSNINAVNALITGEKLEGRQPEKIFEEAESFTEEQFTKSHMDMLPKAASANTTFQQKIDASTRRTFRLENQKSLFWTVCFGFQSMGIICGLTFMYVGGM